MDPKLVTPFVIAAFFVWVIYRRLRRTFGRQTVSEGRMWFRTGLLIVIGCVVLAASWADRMTLGALFGGLVCGSALGYLGLRHTQFEVTPEGRFYTPHTYIGLLVSALFLGRLLYRFLSVNFNAQAADPANQNFLATLHRSPITVAIFGVLVSYYVLYNVGVLRRTKLPTPSEQPANP